MDISRRKAMGLLAGGAMGGGLRLSPAAAVEAEGQCPITSRVVTLTLDNGLRTHILANGSRYISAALVLRSRQIDARDGLAHILEHTSFTGSAGRYSARQIADMHDDYLQDSGASTEAGIITWQASFLPKHLEPALSLLAVTSLDQKLDVDTVAAEARIVLQELYLDKYHTRHGRRRLLAEALYGSDHPYGADTTEAEIARAKTPAPRLAAQLRDYARTLQLPANMDLFLVGGFHADAVRGALERSFGRFPFARGPMLALPKAPVTSAHKAFVVLSPELRKPLSKLRIAWNTGVAITHPEASAVLALSKYLNDMLFSEIRGRLGDAYNVEALYDPDICSGVFEISIPSTRSPERIEHTVFECIAGLKSDIDARKLERFRDRIELTRRQEAESADALCQRLMQRVVNGGSLQDLDLEKVTREDVLAAARAHLPSHKGAYIRLSLVGP